MSPSSVRPLAGLVTVVVLAGIVFFAIRMFNGGFGTTVPVTVISERAGLVMNPEAKVKINGVQVGFVESIDELSDGRAAIRLAMNPQEVSRIPSNVGVQIASSTVFGAKFVELETPADPSPAPLRSNQVITADRVTVEVNTVFQRLTSVLAAVEPQRLNETLSALSSALSGRGAQFGSTIADLDALLDRLAPSLPNLEHDIATSVPVLDAYADAAPDLLRIVDDSTRLGRTVVDEQGALDTFLLSAIGVAGVGTDVLTANREQLTTVLHDAVPTTDLLRRYDRALNCALVTMIGMARQPPLKEPGAAVLTGFNWGAERYRYPSNLPKVAAKGGPQCLASPVIPPEARLPFVVADTGANPWKYDNPRLLLNSDGLKQALFGPIDGPPRNSAQIGQPG